MMQNGPWLFQPLPPGACVSNLRARKNYGPPSATSAKPNSGAPSADGPSKEQLQQQVQALREQVESLEANNLQRGYAVQELQMKLTHQQEAMAVTRQQEEGKRSELHKEIQALKGELEAREADLHVSRAELDTLRPQLTAFGDQVTSLDAHKASLELCKIEAQRRAQEETERLAAEHAAQHAQLVQRLTADHAAALEQFKADAAQSLQDKEAALMSRETALAEMQSTFDKMKVSALAALDSDRKALSEQQAALAQREEALNAQAQKLADEEARLTEIRAMIDKMGLHENEEGSGHNHEVPVGYGHNTTVPDQTGEEDNDCSDTETVPDKTPGPAAVRRMLAKDLSPTTPALHGNMMTSNEAAADNTEGDSHKPNTKAAAMAAAAARAGAAAWVLAMDADRTPMPGAAARKPQRVVQFAEPAVSVGFPAAVGGVGAKGASKGEDMSAADSAVDSGVSDDTATTMDTATATASKSAKKKKKSETQILQEEANAFKGASTGRRTRTSTRAAM